MWPPLQSSSLLFSGTAGVPPAMSAKRERLFEVDAFLLVHGTAGVSCDLITIDLAGAFRVSPLAGATLVFRSPIRFRTTIR
jgi:hypothetical protein